ncbi:MAG: ABC transporter ATP-binding protein [Anaerolineales bacterium]|nr:ABC transporter ATP-binding protein [Anaerolineales bacterium]
MTMLTLNRVTRYFGGLAAVNDVSFEAEANQITGLIGPNGAGKTTLLNLISGLDQPASGEIRFMDRAIQKLPPHKINQLGIARTYQNIRLFAEMSALDNIIVGMHTQGKAGLLSAALSLPGYRAEEKRLREQALQLAERLGLGSFCNTPADALSYGDQRRVEIARALAAHPKLLLLDEPTAGMNAAETARLGELILSLRDEGLAALVIEHDMSFIAQVCDHVVVLNFGEVIARGTVDAVKSDPTVVAAYLGEEEAADA